MNNFIFQNLRKNFSYVYEVKTNISKFRKEHMLLHREGRQIIKNVLIYLIIINGVLYFLSLNEVIFTFINILSILLFITVLYFFRNPERTVIPDDNIIYAPADGKIVFANQTVEEEYFKEPCMQISIFMSPLNVHVNRVPVSGKVKYYKYHPGNYLVAWHPKSSVDNEHTSVVLQTVNGKEVLLRQIAGAVARRVVCYAKEGNTFQQGQDLGFIKFGSRVDVLLPLNSKIRVKLGDHVKGNKTILADI